MSLPTAEDRYAQLRDALARLAERRPGLRSELHDDRCEMILQTDPEAPIVMLRAGLHSTTIHAYSGSEPGGTSQIEDHLSISLTRDFRWDHVVFEDADDLAYHLYKHMLRRQKAVSSMEPSD